MLRCTFACLLFAPWPLLADWPAAITATAWVRSGDRGVGTGWVVDTKQRWLLTARHVVADREQVEAFFPDPNGDSWHLLRRHYIEQQRALAVRGRLVTGKVIARHNQADLALVQLAALPPQTTALTLADDVRSGEEVRLVGHRHDVETLWTVSTGVVRQLGPLRDGYFWAAHKLGVGAKVVFVQMPVEAGDSGGAVLNNKGEVVGLLSAFSNRTAGVGIAIHRDEIQSLLADARHTKSPPPTHATADQRTQSLLAATVWLRPEATETRCAGVLIDRKHRLILTSLAGAGSDDLPTVVFPQWHEQQLRPEVEHYRDLLGQRLAGLCVQGMVLARDPARDLALIQVRQIPATAQALKLAEHDVTIGSAIHTMSHPLGVELLWLYASGRVRSTAKIALQTDAKDADPRPNVHVLQVPHHGHSSGGLVANDQGELVGIIASRESPRHELGYCASVREVQAFLTQTKPRWQPTTPAEIMARADYLADRGWGSEAIAVWQSALEREPTSVPLRLRFAFAYLAVQQADAGRKLAHALLTESLTADEQGLLGRLFVQLNEPKVAEPLLAKALQANPKCIPALLGRATLRSGQEALADLDEVLFLDPNNAEAFALRATKHDPRDPDLLGKQLADLSRVLELKPYALAPRRQRAELYGERKEWKKASADAERLTELASMDREAWQSLAKTHLQAHNELKAVPAFVAIVRIEPRQWATVCQDVRQYGQRLTDTERACEWYEQALRNLQPWIGKQQPWIGELLQQRKAANATDWRLLVETALSKLRT